MFMEIIFWVESLFSESTRSNSLVRYTRESSRNTSNMMSFCFSGGNLFLMSEWIRLNPSSFISNFLLNFFDTFADISSSVEKAAFFLNIIVYEP
ncbi:hypothetical protein D3C75_742800 [compost metagenome]